MDGQRHSSRFPPREPDDSRRKLSPKRASWRSEELFGATNEVVILHDGEEYRLRITRNNKLILTK